MGKIVATYLVKVTLREPEDTQDSSTLPDPPTNDAVAEAVAAVLSTTGLVANATSERTDK